VIFFSFGGCGLLFIKKRNYEESINDAIECRGGPLHPTRPLLLRILPLRSAKYPVTHSDKDLAAATTFKYAADGYVDFGTRLFLRMEKTMLEATPQV
jgi:hypothetical protein